MEAIRAYLKEIKNIPLLKPEEEIELAIKIKKGNKAARKKMIQSNLRLVINVAKRYIHFGVPLMDLIEEGNIGLMRAVDKFNHKKGFRFSTYATWWIRQAITRFIADHGKLIRVPVYMNDQLVQWKKTINDLKQKLGREPLQEEIAKKMQVPISKVEEISKWVIKTGSLEAPIGDNEEGQIIDLVENTQVASPDEEVTKLLKHERIGNLLAKVTDKEKKVLNLRFGLIDQKPMTLAQVANKLKVSRERIRQIEENALSKLKNMINQENREQKVY
ncbi:MAG: sigma-70 family RNA polymerase sigma factor [Candidatus Omnitrophota bacterium]